MQNQRGSFAIFIIIGIIIALGFAAGAFYLGRVYQSSTISKATPSQEPTPIASSSSVLVASVPSGWKNFLDPAGNFSFYYPSDWDISSCENAPSGCIQVQSRETPSQSIESAPPAMISVGVWSNPQKLALKQLLNQFYNNDMDQLGVKIGTVNINGHLGYKYDVPLTNTSSVAYVFPRQNGDFIQVMLTPYLSDLSQGQGYQNQQQNYEVLMNLLNSLKY